MLVYLFILIDILEPTKDRTLSSFCKFFIKRRINMMFIRLFLYECGVHCLKLKIYSSLLIHTFIFPHKIYRRKTKPAYMMFRAYALFHHIIFFILEALRHWLNEEEHVLLPHNKISLLLLETIFLWFNVAQMSSMNFLWKEQ